jgi:hypothetical protein
MKAQCRDQACAKKLQETLKTACSEEKKACKNERKGLEKVLDNKIRSQTIKKGTRSDTQSNRKK